MRGATIKWWYDFMRNSSIVSDVWKDHKFCLMSSFRLHLSHSLFLSVYLSISIAFLPPLTLWFARRAHKDSICNIRSQLAYCHTPDTHEYVRVTQNYFVHHRILYVNWLRSPQNARRFDVNFFSFPYSLSSHNFFYLFSATIIIVDNFTSFW